MPSPNQPVYPIPNSSKNGIDLRTHVATQLLAGLMAKPSPISEGIDGHMRRAMGVETTESKVEEAVKAADLLIIRLSQ